MEFIRMPYLKYDYLKRNDFGNYEANTHFLNETGVFFCQKRVLEIGSGKGHLLNHYYKNGFDIRGIEIDNHKIEESKMLYGELPLKLVLPSQKIPFRDNFFDIVISFDVFEHIPNIDSHLKEVNRVLKRGGYYLLSTPNKLTNTIFETIKWKSFTKWKEGHCSLVTPKQLKKRFKENGFVVEFLLIPVVNEFFRMKLKSYLGEFGIFLLKFFNPDSLPLYFRTNLFVKTKKI